jgi:hypothetical protein
VQRIRASIVYPLSGSAGVITLYGKTEGPENDVTAQLVCDRLKDALTAGHSLFTTNTTFHSDTFVDTIDPATGVITDSVAVTGWDVVGDQGTAFMPPANQLVATWHTTAIIAGRRVRGRTFLGPLAAVDTDTDGTPSGTRLGHLDALINAWQDAGITSTSTCVWHRPVGGAGGSDHTIISGTRSDKYAVLRSRRD